MAFDFLEEKDWELFQFRYRVRGDDQVEPSLRFERTFRPKDGRAIQTLVSASLIFGPDGKAMSTIELVHDLSELRTQQRIIEEQRAQMIAASKLSSLGEMASGIAHEINNPLNAIQLNAGLLKRQMRKATQETSTGISSIAYIEKIEKLVRRIAAIIEGLRKFSREDLSLSKELEEVPIRDLIEEGLSFCRERFRVHGVELIVEEIPASLKVTCRPVQVSQVLLNLLNNAFDAVVSHHRTGMHERRVRIGVSRQGQWMAIAVEDNGPGVPPELTERIFEPFFTTKPFGQGTGLGLSISRGMVEAFGGRLILRPGIEGGARFVVLLPDPHPILNR